MTAKVSILHRSAAERSGASSSHIVVDEADMSPEVLTLAGWSPVLYSKPRRAIANFLEANVVGFDVDEGLTLKAALELVKDYRHYVGTTASHQKPKGDKPACDRFRILLFPSEPILSADDYRETLIRVAREIGIPADKGASDAARWFLPCVNLVSVRNDGKLIPVYHPESDIVTLMPRAIAASAGAKGKLSKATRDFLAQEPSADPWHHRFIKAAMDLKEQGYSQDEASLRLRSASPAFDLDDTDLNQLQDVYENRGGALEFRPAWPEMAPPTKTSPARPDPYSILNQRYLLTEVLGYTFEANSRREVVYYKTRENQDRQLLSDIVLAKINTGAREHRIQAGDSLRDLIVTIAQEHAFDPILGPLRELKHDGREHIKALFKTITLPDGASDEARDWYQLFLRRWLIGVVTKVFHPGSENNVLVFQGAQAAGKSRWLKRLAELWPEGFGEGHISPDDKDHELRHLDNFIWHVAEFDSTTSRREVGALKDYFTKDTVNVRRPYARLPIVGRSICSFCASVNSHEFLHDATGNRRYLVIPVVRLDANHAVDIRQVMAEAKAAMEAGERSWFTREEIDQVNALNGHFLSKEEYLEAIEARAKPGADELTLKGILEAVGHDDLLITRPVRSNIRTVLERNGVKKAMKNGCTVFLVDSVTLKKGGVVVDMTEGLKSKRI